VVTDCNPEIQVNSSSTWPIEPLVHNVVDTAARLDLSRSSIYELLKSGDLKSLKIGRRRLIERTEIERFLASRRPA